MPYLRRYDVLIVIRKVLCFVALASEIQRLDQGFYLSVCLYIFWVKRAVQKCVYREERDAATDLFLLI